MRRQAEGNHGANGEVAIAAPCNPSELLTPAVWQALAEEMRLSDRELEIAQGFLDGLDERGIAIRIGISEHTIHTHVRRMYQKTHTNSRCEFLICLFVSYLTYGRHYG